MDLHLLDMSNYIYQGCYSRRRVSRGVREGDGAYIENSAPSGAIDYVCSNLRELVADKNNVVVPVFDRTPTIKRQMYYNVFCNKFGYKGTRPPKDDVIKLSKSYVEDVLRKCEFPVQAVDGYEADDIIHTLTNYYKDYYEHVYIHTRDSDLAYLVSDNVSIAKVGTQGKIINMTNFEDIAYSKHYIKYNMITIEKLLDGDSSDNIMGIGRQDWAHAINEQFAGTPLYKNNNLDYTREMLFEMVNKHPELPNAMQVVPLFNLLVPLDVPIDMLDDTEYNPNLDMFFNYYCNHHDKSKDIWGCEEMLLEYIDSYY